MKKQISSILLHREAQEVEKAWRNAGVSYQRVRYILSIVAKHCDWRSINFIPSDKCACAFMDHDLELGAIAAIAEIEESCTHMHSGELYESLHPESDLLDLIRLALPERNGG